MSPPSQVTIMTKKLTWPHCTAQSATAIYSYAATSDEELSFEEGDTLSIVDSSDESWWKAERGGFVGLVPATYVELSQ